MTKAIEMTKVEFNKEIEALEKKTQAEINWE